jgi:hypothetical protein
MFFRVGGLRFFAQYFVGVIDYTYVMRETTGLLKMICKKSGGFEDI